MSIIESGRTGIFIKEVRDPKNGVVVERRAVFVAQDPHAEERVNAFVRSMDEILHDQRRHFQYNNKGNTLEVAVVTPVNTNSKV